MKKTVEVPAKMADHKDTKIAVESQSDVEKAKNVTAVKDKLSRAQILENMKLDLAKAAEGDLTGGARALEVYSHFFQLSETEELLKMVQKVDTEAGLIRLKHGYNLPIILKEDSDLNWFLNVLIRVLNPEQSPFLNMIEVAQDTEFGASDEVWAGVYAFITLLSYGRQAPNIDWLSIETEDFEPNPDYFFNSVFKVVEAYVANPEAGAGKMKGMLQSLIPDTFDGMFDLFQRDSLKKLGIVISSPSEGEGVLFSSSLADVMCYVMYDLFSPIVPAEEAEEPEVGEPQQPTQKAGKEPTQSPKEETGEDEIPEEYAADGVGEDDIVEEEDIVEDDDDIVEDEEEI